MKTLESPKETIIYGGAFNPPTRAHQAIVQACVGYAEKNDADIWLLPSGDRTDKTIEASTSRRLDMLAALTHDIVARNVAIDINTTELERSAATETYDTVREFNQEYPDRQFTWVFGSDSVATMPEWHGGQWMMDHLHMLVVERPGTPIKQLGRLATRLPVDMISTSSTEVRNRMQKHLPVDDLVSPTVLNCLQMN